MSENREIYLEKMDREGLIDLIFRLKEDLDEACGLMRDVLNSDYISSKIEKNIDRFLSTEVPKIK